MAKKTVFKNTFVYEYKEYNASEHGQVIEECDDCHPTLAAAIEAGKQVQENMSQLEQVRNFTFSTNPDEIEDTMVLDGKLADNGCAYEDYAVVLTKENTESVLIEHLLSKYIGHEVEITIKFK